MRFACVCGLVLMVSGCYCFLLVVSLLVLLVVGIRFRVAVWWFGGFWWLLSFVRWVRFRWLLLVVFAMVFAVWGVRWSVLWGALLALWLHWVGWHVLWGCLGGLRFVDFVLRVVSAGF